MHFNGKFVEIFALRNIYFIDLNHFFFFLHYHTYMLKIKHINEAVLHLIKLN